MVFNFASLPTELQNIYMFEFSQLSKFILFFGFLILAILWIINEDVITNKKTHYLTVAISRLLFFAVSRVFLFVSPVLFILLDPQNTFWTFYGWMIILYLVLIGVIMLLFVIDVIRFGFLFMLEKMGFDVHNPAVRDVVNALSKKAKFGMN